MDAKLRILDGPSAGHTVEVKRGKLLIGRAPDCDFRPASQMVSAYHCVLLQDGYTLRIRDLASKNGTRVNGRRIGNGSTILLHDDKVCLGDMNLLVDLTQSAPSAGLNTGMSEGDVLQTPIPGEDPSTASPETPVTP
jgi:pSer/pThr/pTyr-binding forkhead associated (FHA) protein